VGKRGYNSGSRQRGDVVASHQQETKQKCSRLEGGEWLIQRGFFDTVPTPDCRLQAASSKQAGRQASRSGSSQVGMI